MSLTPYVHLDQPLAGRRAGDGVSLSPDEQHHLRSVLRLGDGDPIEVADGVGGHAPARLADAVAELADDPVLQPPPRPALRVVHALPKGRKLDEVVRAATELGLDELVPVIAERSVSRPTGARADKAVGRWRAVARAAAEQARRPHRPEIAPVAGLGDLTGVDGLLVAEPGAPTSLPRALDGLADAEAITVAIGPEGGFSPAEVDALSARGARPVGLGEHVLRTEHAAAAALAVAAACCGRWG